jgi:hypothetical protein
MNEGNRGISDIHREKMISFDARIFISWQIYITHCSDIAIDEFIYDGFVLNQTHLPHCTAGEILLRLLVHDQSHHGITV